MLSSLHSQTKHAMKSQTRRSNLFVNLYNISRLQKKWLLVDDDDVPAGQAIFHLLRAKINGQGTRQPVDQLNKKVNCETSPGQSKLESCLSKRQAGIQAFFEPCIQIKNNWTN